MLSNIYIVILTVVCVDSSPVRLPLIVDEFGDVHLNAVVENLYGPDPLRYRLSTFFTSSNRQPESAFPGRVLEQVISLMSENISNEITRYNTNVFVGSPSLWENGIAVGSHSQMVGQFTSVDLINVLGSTNSDIRLSAFLELGDSYESFSERFCTIGSIFNATLNDAEQTVGFIDGYDGGMLLIEFARSPVPWGLGHMGHRIALPGILYEEIEAVIRQTSGRIVRDTFGTDHNLVFESCAQVREQLDFIKIHFVDPRNDTRVQGWLVFEPSDFTIPIDSLNDTCELVIGNGGEDETIAIDVLMLQDVNLRFTRNQITFCDTSV